MIIMPPHIPDAPDGVVRRRRRPVLLAALPAALVLLTGCPQPQAPVDEPRVVEADPPPAPANPPQAAPRSPEQVIADFQALQPVLRTDERLIELSELPRGLDEVTTLNLGGSAVTDGGAARLPAFTEVQQLNLASSRVTGAALTHIGRLPKLQALNLQHIPLDAAQLDPLAESATLRDLDLSNSAIGEDAFEQIARLNRLEVLTVDSNPLIVGKGFSAQVAHGRFESLQSLSVSDTQFGFFGFEQARRLGSLQSLRAINAFVTDEALEDLKACRTLRVLDLSKNKITDAGLRHLAGLSSLEELHLAGCAAVSDAGLNDLRRHTQLRFLNLDGTRCTRGAVAQLKERFLTQTTIRFDGTDL